MKIFKTGALAAIGVSAAMLLATLPAQAGNVEVNMIYPPKLASDFDQPDKITAERKSATGHRVLVIWNIKSRSFYRWRRRYNVNRALFQNYPSSRRKYGGRLYPF